MDVNVFDNPFFAMSYDEDLKLMKFYWKQKTEDATPEDFKEWNRNLVAQVHKYNPPIVLSDTRDYWFTIEPELQEWSVENVLGPIREGGIQKLAILASTKFIAQLSIEQFIDEGKENISMFQTSYFDDEQKAMNWLFERN